MANSRSHIRVATSGEAPFEAPKPVILTLNQAIESGNYLEILRAQRRDIVDSLPDERGPAKAALHRQLALISKEIQAIELKESQTAKEDADGASVDDEAWDAEAL